ncbi:hypothetical protein Harman_25390 [Haloarcula mannanilytica]|uniref:Uncharacterized protein n=1 Tax=Haloarcula mannanilytica TaxID=2509225 RepID=A0A4C2EJE1_9EURY|nr:hypothetical protein [Haloarcula mannanilytica]GCF14604.1 hypothetical protein Harman_25390 [Haloarcula mannanilytica]
MKSPRITRSFMIGISEIALGTVTFGADLPSGPVRIIPCLYGTNPMIWRRNAKYAPIEGPAILIILAFSTIEGLIFDVDLFADVENGGVLMFHKILTDLRMTDKDRNNTTPPKPRMKKSEIVCSHR